MNTRNFAKQLVILTVFGFLAACGGGGSAPPADTTAPPASVTTSINAAGGTVNGPDGVQVVIPAGALDQPTTIGIARDRSGALEVGGLRLISPVYAITPHGTQFADGARISIPFNPANVAPGTQPIIIKSQPGSTWTALVSEVAGSSLSADISGLSYYAVGTCYTSRDVLVPGPDPLIACPSAHSLKLELLDGAGAALPVLRSSSGVAMPVLVITEPTQLKFAFSYSRPPSGRLDYIFMLASGAVTPSDWPRDRPLGGPNDTPILAGYQTTLTFDANLGTVPNASRSGGTIVRFRASVTTQMDAFYPGCLCFKPASWIYEAEVPVRVIYNAPPAPPVVTHTIGGTVSGLTGAGLVLRNNGGNNRAVTANGAFTFATALGAGSPYNVTVLTQPSGQTCTVQNGSGTATSNVTTVAVDCVATVTHTIGGSVTGLTGTGLVLRNNGSDNRAVTVDGAFTFATAIGAGAPYSVTVLIQPAGQTCTVTDGSGTANANVTTVAVRCVVASAKAWQGAALLETLDPGEALGPQIAFDANGNAMAIWYQVSTAGKYNIYARRYAPGSGWAAVVQFPPDPLWNNNYRVPQIAFTPGGNAIAVFEGCNPDSCAIWTAQFTAASSSWGIPTQLADVGANPQIAIDTNGNAMVVWDAWNGNYNDIRAQRYVASTSTWEAARGLSADIGGTGPQIAFDANGNAIAIWEHWDASNARYTVMSDRYAAASGWNPQGLPTTVGVGLVNRSHRLAVDAAGNAMAVWTQSDGTTNSIYSSRYVGARWSTPGPVETSANYATQSSVAVDASGNAIVVWSEVGNSNVTSTWARRYVAGVGGTAARIDEQSTSTSAGFPQIAMDAAGNGMAVWTHASYIWANRYVAGTGWRGAALIDSTAAGGNSSSPQVAVDVNGNAVAVWLHFGTTSPNIWANVFR